MDGSIGKLLARTAVRSGEAVALVCDGRQWSYRELDERSSSFAAALARHGISTGETVSLYAPNSAEWVIGYYGALKRGCVVNPLNLMLTPGEAAFAMNDCGAVAVIGTADRVASLADADPVPALRLRISWNGTAARGAHDFDAFIADVAASDWTIPEIASEQTSTIGYTSGTTGHPKGAQSSHHAVLLNAAMTATMHGRTAQDVTFSALPLSHVYGNIVMNATFLVGGRLILHAAFDPANTLRSIAQHRVTLFEGVPTMYLYMLALPELASHDLSSLQRCTVGGQTMPLAKMEEVEVAFGCRLIELWGMTELAGLGTTHALLGPARLGSIGVPLPSMEARITMLTEPEQPLSEGEVGELQIRGPLVMQGYLGRPAATDEVMLPGRWLRTGDLAYRDRDGFYFVVDRLKDMIITGGFNIYPAELERVVAQHPAVAMVAVCGIDDPLKGEIAAAFVVLHRGHSADAATLEAHCRQNLAAYKVPRMFHFVDDLPRTSSGKVLRRALSSLL